MDAILRIFLAYLLGSLVGSLVLGRLRGIDIRTQGSGNAGGTNALRTQGAAFALGVIAIDVAKGWCAVVLLPSPSFGGWLGLGLGAGSLLPLWLPSACGLAATVGHVYPAFFGLRGGKGAATLVGAVAGLAPAALPLMFFVWFAMVVVLGFVGLATMTAAATLPLAILAVAAVPRGPLLLFGLAAAGFVIYTHRSNIARMRAGTEPRARRLWLFGRGRS